MIEWFSRLLYCHIIFILGDGKSYFIHNDMRSCERTTCIAVNEGFTPGKAIEKLRTLLCDTGIEQKTIGIHLNITIYPPWVRKLQIIHISHSSRYICKCIVIQQCF